MQHTTDIAIIGGGVIGCSIAYHLRKAGANVTVIERAEIAVEASSAAAGLLSPLGNLSGPGPFTDLMLASWMSYPQLIPELETLSGVQVEYHQAGSLRVADAEDEVAQLRQQMAAWQAMGIEVEWLTCDEACRREPLLGQHIVAAVYAPREGSIKAPAMTRAYAEAARKLGASFYEHTEVTGLQRSGSRITGIETAGGETIACGHLVIAAGTWSARCGEWLGLKIPVIPMRGQIFSLKQPQPPMKHILFGGIYLIPKLDGTIYAGATVEQAGFDKHNTAGGISELLTLTLELAPALASAPIVKIWAGLRPWSPDSRPILGKAPGWENVTIATGHSAIGFEASAITGQTIAELITTGQTPAIIRPFGIERFGS